ncbi:MAG: hypothetical protein FWD63_00750 [Propionibacteriaceae bacterium]|nr:hypothetical protein [Propionibacteriaceae bacterium]
MLPVVFAVTDAPLAARLVPFLMPALIGVGLVILGVHQKATEKMGLSGNIAYPQFDGLDLQARNVGVASR